MRYVPVLSGDLPSRRFVVSLLFAGLLSAPHGAIAQDPGWLRDYENAQRDRPRSISEVGRIASPSEPGTPLYIHGKLFQRDGVTPAPGVIVFAYQTDASGLYNGAAARGWRLRGWARTNSEGRFEFRTIRPGSYPGSRIAAHVHFTIESPGIERRTVSDLNFSDDPFVSEGEKQRSAREGRFGGVRSPSTRDGVQHVAFEIRVGDRGTF